jgi:hypothetical protein
MHSIRMFLGSCLAVVALTAGHRNATDDHMAHMSPGDMAAPSAASMAGQGSGTLPASNNAAKARLAASPRHGEWVKVAWEPGSSDSLMAWIVYPSTTSPKTPVVVVVHEMFGLSSWVRGVADQMAADGFIAIAPDLVSRVRGGPSAEEGCAHRSRHAGGGLRDEVPRQELHGQELRRGGARISAGAGRSQGAAAGRRRGAGEPRRDERRVAPDARLPATESRDAVDERRFAGRQRLF